MRRWVGFAAAVAACALPCAAAAQETRSFRDWWAACSEQRTCWAFGFAPDLSLDGFVRVERLQERTAHPVVLLAAPAGEGENQPQTLPLTVSVEGAEDWRFPVLTARADGNGYYVAEVREEAGARGLLNAAKRGSTLRLQLRGRPEARVSLSGATAALLWIDERQKRVGTLTAMGRPGAEVLNGVPSPPPRRVVRAAAPVSQGRLPTALPAAVARRPEIRECLEGVTLEEFRKPEVSRLDAGTLLWGVTCAQGAYQTSARYFLSDLRGRRWRPAPFQPAGDDGEDWVTNGGFDAKTMTLGSFAKGRGLADCGVGSQWVWTGRAFVLVHETVMVECRGVPGEYWPVTVDADVRR